MAGESPWRSAPTSIRAPTLLTPVLEVACVVMSSSLLVREGNYPSRRLRHDLEPAGIVAADRLLDRHVQVAGAFQLVRAGQRTGVHGAHSARLDQLPDLGLRVVVVTRDEHVEWL